MTIDIILPVYEEEEGLPIFHAVALRRRGRSLAASQLSNDLCARQMRDNSVAVLKDIATRDSRVTVLHLSRRFGHQMSLVAGLDHSDGDATILMDCDMQHPPEVIPKLLEKFDQGYDVVQAIRTYDARIHPRKNGHLVSSIRSRKLAFSNRDSCWGSRLSPDFAQGSKRVSAFHSRAESIPARIVSVGWFPSGHRGVCPVHRERRGQPNIGF